MMKTTQVFRTFRSTAVAAAIAALLSGPAFAGSENRLEQAKDFASKGVMMAATKQAERIIENWPEVSRKVALSMIESYGEPDGVTATMLVWNDNGPWLQTIVSRDPVEHNFPMPHKDVLAQSVYLEVSPELFDELARYDGSVIVERTKGTITARCDKEAANFLALNLANDIVQERRTVEEARRYYATAIQRMKQDGDKDPYLKSLRFQPMTASTAGDPDQQFERMAQTDAE